MEGGYRIGVDLGGTKIAAVALAPDGSELARLRRPTPRDYPGTVEAVARLVEELERSLGVRGTVGAGIPGALDPRTGVVRNANSTWLIGHALHLDLAERLGRPVRVANDANCFALSEAVDGAGAGADVVFGVILGTGVGGGIVVGGRVLEGVQRIAGEWGHDALPWPTDLERPGPACYCGKRGCIETFLSGPALEADHLRWTGDARATREIAAAVDRGGAEAATYARWVERSARSLAMVVNILDPDVVVLGGGLSQLPEAAERIEAGLSSWVFNERCATRVVRNVHGDAGGVRGAAWLWPTE